MSCSYLYELRRKSEDFEQNFEPIKKRENSNLSNLSELSKDDDIWEVPEESFENVYTQMDGFKELLNDDHETEEDELNAIAPPSPFNLKEFKNPKTFHLSLSTDKIALKSQQLQSENSNRPQTTTMMMTQQIINKSINTETDVEKSMTTGNTTDPNTINTTSTTTTMGNKVQWKNVKITSNNNNNNNGAKTKQTNSSSSKSLLNFSIVPINLTQGHKKNKNEQLEDLKKIPEIKLTSFSNKKSTKIATPTIIKPNSGFSSTGLQDLKISSNIPRRKSSSGSETNKHITDCSTSPESVLDNILSAASSVSVQSSSLSSNELESSNRINDLKIRENSLILPYKEKNNMGILKNQLPELKIISAPDSPLNQQPTGTHISPSLLTISNISHSDSFETASNRSRSPSASPLRSLSVTRVTPEVPLYPEELKCQICNELFKDPRSLSCLHSFCFQCIVNENFKQDASIPFWSQPQSNQSPQHSSPQQQQLEERDWKDISSPNQSIRSASPEIQSVRSNSDLSNSPSQQKRRSSFSFKRKKSADRLLYKNKSDNSSVTQQNPNATQRPQGEITRLITCKICQFPTEVPIGGIRQLAQNFLLVRRIEEIRFKVGEEVIARVWCSLCFEETNATYHCLTCILNLCTLCKDAHERQKNTTKHNIKNIMELRRARKEHNAKIIDNSKFILKCSMHPGFDIKSFCTICLQVACTDCLILLHKGHKHEPISKSVNYYSRILRESVDQTRPLCNYAEHSIGKLNEIAKSINRKCDEIQSEVEEFMANYFEAVEVHKSTLLQQVHRARESKVEMILEQQLDLEKRTQEALLAVKFSQELVDVASDVEILSFVKMLLQRFEYCQQFKAPVDPKISDSLHFLPKIRAPAAKNLNDIPLFGIITMQTVEPSLCTLQWDGVSQLRLHTKAELVLISRDADGASLCHGGLQIQAQIKYKDNSKPLPIEVSDNRDGSYVIAFTPDSQGILILTITINDKPIKASPFSFQARCVRPHNGIYHCCAFCSSKGNKFTKCSCDGRMPGYNGCGHGHAGHPGRRHWSCCGNILENSECNVANKISPSASPLRSLSVTRVTPEVPLYPEELKCQICNELFKDPRSLNCLHSFCFQCIVNENFKQDASIPFWSQPQSNKSPQLSSPQQQQLEERDWKDISSPNQSIRSASPEIQSVRSNSDLSNSPSQQKRRSSFSFKRKKSADRLLYKNKSDNSSVSQQNPNATQRPQGEITRLITCKICQFPTEVPIGGIRQLAQNFLLVRRIEEIRFKVGEEVIARVWCSLCFEETNATYHCLTCILNLCTLCKDAHERQKNTTKHNIKNIMELRRARKEHNAKIIDNSKFILKCSMHPGFDIKSFCTICLQVACTDCLILLHKGHKHEPISKSVNNYSRILRESVDQTRPLCNYAEHSIGKLNEIAKSINRKCDEVQSEVEEFMANYFEAVEVHKSTLLQQVHRARESKVEMILEQQLDLEKRTQEALLAVKFSQELVDVASDVEILSFVKMLLQRFEYCQQFKAPVDPKISDSLHFLPKIRAPAAKNLNDIPLFGIITMQTVEPSLCTLQWDGVSQLRLHTKAELVLISRDADGASLCHGGLQIQAQIKYKDNSKPLPIEVSDNRDGSYVIAFTPDSQGILILTITINDKPIKASPFSFQARCVRPHNGIYHCCAFCSSKGNKFTKCSCDGRMPGYNGCGHGHAGHPGRRHWSCCGNILENSECNVANKMLNI